MKGPRKYERVIWEKGVGADRKKAKAALPLPSLLPFYFSCSRFLSFKDPAISEPGTDQKVVAYKRLKAMEKFKTITTSVGGRLRYVARVIVYEN